jgi:hypothetical protein
MERRIEIEEVELLSDATPATGVEAPTIDLGLHLEGTPKTVRFPITNTGSKPLNLLSAKADCGCTTATLPEQPIAPGTTEEVEVRFSGRAPAGPLERHITITTDGDPNTVVLTLTGTIVTHK